MNATAMIAAATSPALRPNHALPAKYVAATVADAEEHGDPARAARNTAPASSANHCSTPPRWMTLSYAARMYVSSGGLMK